MSKEKLYAVKNDEGKYLTIERTAPWWDSQVGTGVRSTAVALAWARKHGGQVVTLVEEPEKEAVSENVGKAIDSLISADTYAQAASAFQYIFASRKKKDLKRLMKAVRNGYTVANEKKYLVYKELGGKKNNKQFAQAYRLTLIPDTIIWLIKEHIIMSSDASDQFTESEIEHYGLQDCEKEEVTDDEV